MNDPVAVLLVTGFIDWIEEPGYGIADMALEFVGDLAIGAVVGVGVGHGGARWAFIRLDYPTPGLYPVASMAAAAISFGARRGRSRLRVPRRLPDRRSPSAPGSCPPGARSSAFHQGLELGRADLAVLPARAARLPRRPRRRRVRGLGRSRLALIFVARPIATLVAHRVRPAARFGERLMLELGRPARRGADLARDLPRDRRASRAASCSSTSSSSSSSPRRSSRASPSSRWPQRLGLTTNEPALPQPLVETGSDPGARRRRRSPSASSDDDAVVGHGQGARPAARGAGQPDRPRPRGGAAAGLDRDRGRRRAPRARPRARRAREVGEADPSAGARARSSGRAPVPIGVRALAAGVLGPADPRRATATPARPTSDRRRRGRARRCGPAPTSPAAIVVLADGRFAVTGPDLIAVGGRRQPDPLVRRAGRPRRHHRRRTAPGCRRCIGVIDAPA